MSDIEYPNFIMENEFVMNNSSSDSSWLNDYSETDAELLTVSSEEQSQPTNFNDIPSRPTRFPKFSDTDVDNIIEQSSSKRTKEMTNCHVKIFKGRHKMSLH